ncbi:MAG: hypothetical protein M3Y28_00995 [Armatimonadota bacterium]|nr:hypothetical protein [Armatimonadota bacterium]
MTASSWATVLPAFLASLVEFVEALTIVLAVGTVRGWRPALLGAGTASLLLAVLILLFGPHLAALNMAAFQFVVGILLLLFGLRWLRKAILRAAGVLALHDETQAFAKETAALQSVAVRPGFDFGAAATAFNGVFIEGIEVVFIVLTLGAIGHQLAAASVGAGAAALLVVVLGLIARRPLSQIPENALKLAVGALVAAFGTLWTGEGLGLEWPGGVWAPVGLSLGYFCVAVLGTFLVRRTTARETA